MANPNLIKSTASTMQKVANLPRYRHPADLVNIDIRPIRQQRMQINGELQFGAKLYHSQAQQNLIKQISESRNSFRTSSVEDRNKIASSQYNHWRQYLHLLVTKIPKSELIEGQKRQKVYQSYLIAKERNQQKMQLSKTVRLFYHIAEGFKFDIPIHPLVMMRMVNPDLGYLNNFRDQRLIFDDYVKFLQEMIAISKLFSEGSTLHGSQLLSFAFWRAYTSNPTMKIDQFCKFLTLFKFNIKPQNIQSSLSYHLNSRQGQLTKSSPVRFDLWRNIFLERGL